MDVKKKSTATSPAGGKTDKSSTPLKTGDFALGRENYILMIIGLVLIFLGFVLMIGGKSNDPKVFNEAIFSPQRLTVAPILILAGYVVEIFAIMKKPKDTPPK